MVQKIVTFDVALKSTERQWVQKVPEVYTNDLGSVSLQFRITDCTDTELTGSTAMVLLKMRDGSFFQGPSVDVERTLNVFSYTLKENEGNHDGLAEIQLIVTIGAKEFATQKYNFKVITGLDSEVAREIMIYDWSTLTAEARAYIDQFTADELLRDAEFDNNQFDRNVAFNAAQGQRTTEFGLAQTQRNTDFGTDQAQRVSDFNAAEAARVLAFNNAETARAAGYDADHSRAGTDHTGAVADRANAATDRTNAATDRTNAAADRTLAGTDHTTAAADHTTALSDHAVLGGYNGRLTDVETDTSFDATNLVTNGDFRNGSANWNAGGAILSYSGSTISITGDGTHSYPYMLQSLSNIVIGRKYYTRLRMRVTSSLCASIDIRMPGYGSAFLLVTAPVQNQWYERSFVKVAVGSSTAMVYYHSYASSAEAIGKVMELQYPLTIDLTATFGAGNEPTVEQMDAIMAKFPNSWFDGTKNLFQAKASLNKLMALDARTEFEAKNLVVNGDFNNGTTGWNAIAAVVNGRASKIATEKYMGFTQSVITTIGSNYYVSAMVEGDPLVYLKFGGGTDTRPISTANQKLSLISTATVTNTELRLADGRDTGWTVYYGDNFTVIDLTATFGAGKEPTLVEMDRLMARFPNSWFDGVKPIQTIEQLYQEKANKVQEAWITPTLTNGWITPINTDPYQSVSYRKDNFGVVTVRGNVSSGVADLIFTLPTGYRPVKSIQTPMAFLDSAPAIGFIGSNGRVVILGSYSGKTVALNLRFDTV